ncbi:hypothetical protein [Jannaschia sp. W003]|uniref:hypothetical protein n=1 Tax=Jannaschia sp. W003 TaxID=2867012 RepID=UPI0021A75103|nr:hypothetical protein [Jannaschia sp. W003]UWQ21177.1 hypothetical protein K3554_14560 [Jannaschia sp. W003]
MTARILPALAALALLSACGAPAPTGPAGSSGVEAGRTSVPKVVLSRVPASVPSGDVLRRDGCWYFRQSGQEFPVELTPGRPLCERGAAA